MSPEDKFASKDIDVLIDQLKREIQLAQASVAKREKILGEYDQVESETKNFEAGLDKEVDQFLNIIKQAELANEAYHSTFYEELFELEKTRLTDFKG